MERTKYIFFVLFFTILFACNEHKTNNSKVAISTQTDTTDRTNIEHKQEQTIKMSQVLLSRFPHLNETNKFPYYQELPDSLYELKDNEIEMLKLNYQFPKDIHQYIKWYGLGKRESKYYFSLFLFKTLESVILYQANYSKKDSSLVQLFLLSEWLNPCEELSSTETKKVNNNYIQTTCNEYEEWSEDGKSGTGFVETMTTKYHIQETGKIDSLSSTKKLITNKLK